MKLQDGYEIEVHKYWLKKKNKDFLLCIAESQLFEHTIFMSRKQMITLRNEINRALKEKREYLPPPDKNGIFRHYRYHEDGKDLYADFLKRAKKQ